MKPPFDELARRLKPGQLLTGRVELLTYEVDAALDRARPDGVVFPETTDDVRRIVEWATRPGQPVVPLVARGAGTGLSGGAVAEHGGLVLSFTRMNRILEFDPQGRSAVVEPGVVNLKLDEFVKRSGLYFPPDPASGRSATLGGNIAENAGGPHCFKYGVTTNYLTGLEVVLADGKVINLGGGALDYPEYDFTGLITGSEGTLAIITRAAVRLMRNPPAVQTMMVAFPSVEIAGEAVSAIIARGLVPATLEMMDRKMMTIIEAYAHAGLPVEAEAALIIEVDGFPESLGPQIEEITAILHEFSASHLRVAQTPEERDKIWYGRKSAAGAMARLSPAYYLLDGTVPRSKLAVSLAAINAVCDDLELRVAYVFHAGDGNLHPFVLIEDPTDKALTARVFEAGKRIMEICLRHDGSITGEHGVGIEKRQFMPLMYSQNELDAMQEIKQVFDPACVLNPGKIFPEGSAPRPAPQSSEPLPAAIAPLAEPESAAEAADAIRDVRHLGKTLRLSGGSTQSFHLPETDCRLSTRRLQGIRKLAPEDLYVTVQTGTKLEDLQAELAQVGMFVPLLSPWSGSTIGGLISANLNAPLRLRYGSLRDLLLAAQVVQPDGRVLRLGRPVVKNVAGYDLPKLFVGAMGTLGLVTEATFKLAPLPRARQSLVVPVTDLSQGTAWAQALLPVCLTASSLLLFHGETELSPAPYVLVYTAEGLPADVEAELSQAQQVLQAAGAADIQRVADLSGSHTWAGWLRGQSAAAPAALLRLGVAPKDLPDLVKQQAHRLQGSSFCLDLASGQVWIRDSIGPQMDWTERLGDWSALRQAALQAGGYLVLQPAAANAHLPSGLLDPWGFAPPSLDLMRRLKAAWDPGNLFNPEAFLV